MLSRPLVSTCLTVINKPTLARLRLIGSTRTKTPSTRQQQVLVDGVWREKWINGRSHLLLRLFSTSSPFKGRTVIDIRLNIVSNKYCYSSRRSDVKKRGGERESEREGVERAAEEVRAFYLGLLFNPFFYLAVAFLVYCIFLIISYIFTPAMLREECYPRPDWKQKCSAVGFTFYDNYWDDTICYRLTAKAAEDLRDATDELHKMCMAAVELVVHSDELLREFDVPPDMWNLVRESWENHDSQICGRFDLLYDGKQHPKLLEYNADTPTLLLESGIVQKEWWKDTVEEISSQFNYLDEKLLKSWKVLYASVGEKDPVFHFACVRDHEEDLKNTLYMAKIAKEAGFNSKVCYIDDIRWTGEYFENSYGEKITRMWKLYPWEWITEEISSHQIPQALKTVTWVEPPWKMLLSNKAILPLLWSMYPNHKYLLPSYFSADPLLAEKLPYVEKPRFGREGQNIRLFNSDGTLNPETQASYKPSSDRVIFQHFINPPSFSGYKIIFGSWVVDGTAAGLAIREDKGLISNNDSYFRPHYVDKNFNSKSHHKSHYRFNRRLSNVEDPRGEHNRKSGSIFRLRPTSST